MIAQTYWFGNDLILNISIIIYIFMINEYFLYGNDFIVIFPFFMIKSLKNGYLNYY